MRVPLFQKQQGKMQTVKQQSDYLTFICWIYFLPTDRRWNAMSLRCHYTRLFQGSTGFVYACMRVLVIVRNERSLCMCFVLCLIYVFVYSVYKTVCAHMHSPSHMCLYTLSTCHTPSSVFVSLLYTLFAWAGAKRRWGVRATDVRCAGAHHLQFQHVSST